MTCMSKKNVFCHRRNSGSSSGNGGSIGTPSIFIYNEAGKLVKNFDGETPVGGYSESDVILNGIDGLKPKTPKQFKLWKEQYY